MEEYNLELMELKHKVRVILLSMDEPLEKCKRINRLVNL